MTALTYPSLSDGVVPLRPWRTEDVDAQLAAFTDPIFLQFSDWAPSSPAEVAARLAWVDRVREQGVGLHLAITDADHVDAALGEVSLAGVNGDQLGPASTTGSHPRLGVGASRPLR